MSSTTDRHPTTASALLYITKGEIHRGVRSVQIVLAARNIAISHEISERIVSCTDLDQIERWVQRAATIDTIDQLFH
jgi:hypothetical protein